MLGRAAGRCKRLVPWEGRDTAETRLQGTAAAAARAEGSGGSEGDRPARTLAPGDPPRGCEDVTGRGRRACLLRRGPARLTGACEPCRASSPRRWARTVGPVTSLCLPRGRASGRMASLRRAARGSGTRRSASSRPAHLPQGAASAAPARCEKRGSHAPTVGAGLRPQSLPILFLRRASDATGMFRKATRKPLCF